MLKEIRINNFKCFKNSTTINFEPKKYGFLEENINKDEILKGAIFVGANGVGKSTILKAIKLVIDLVTNNNKYSLNGYKSMFSDSNSIKVDYVFYINGKNIIYDLEYMIQEEVIKEKLFIEEQNIFDRRGSVVEINSPQYEYLEALEKSKSIFADFKVMNKFKFLDEIEKWITYLKKFAYISNGNSREYIFYNKNEYKDFAEYYEQNDVNKINSFLEENKLDFSVVIKKSDFGPQELNKENYMKIINIKRNDIVIPLGQEADGVIELIEFLPYIFYATENECILCIDEFGFNFNYKLKEIIIQYFMKNSKKSQLFLVSNATNLLSNQIFRPDQEYLVQFDKHGSYINRFSNKKIRESQNVEKMYKENRFNIED